MASVSIYRFMCKVFNIEIATIYKTSTDRITGGDLRNGVNGFVTSYATDSARFSQQILDKEHAGATNVFIIWQI